MATKKAATSSEPTSSIDFTGSKMKSLSIRNFRCIGDLPVVVELDDIVVLVGANNAGKSTILRAFEVVTEFGSNEGHLTIADFPNGIPKSDRPTEIVLETYVAEGLPADKWLHEEPSGRRFVRERFQWKSVGEGTRQGQLRDASEGDWEEQVPWGAANVSNARKPKPHRIDAFANPEKQAEQILDLLRDLLIDRAASLPISDEANENAPESRLDQLKKTLVEVQEQIFSDAQAEVSRIEERVGSFVKDLFPGYKVRFNARPEAYDEKHLKLFANATLEMGKEGEYLSPIEMQGSGARRALLWGALKSIGDVGKPSKKSTSKTKKAQESSAPQLKRSNILLLDEPEICLHPSAIREACKVLYDLAKPENGWQVMVTTHSPVFIDLSRDNTTVVRVERFGQGEVRGTTLFRPDRAKLSSEDRECLKLLNLWDPYVAEFFFGGKTVLVEGDTEYSIFRYLLENKPRLGQQVHIVRARGKAILTSLIKIMNHFGANYCVLHDSDLPINKSNGSRNAMWTENNKILQEVKNAPQGCQVRLVCSIENIEEALFGEASSKDKPYSAIQKLQSNANLMAKADDLLSYLLQGDTQVKDAIKIPLGFAEWDDLEELQKIVEGPEPISLRG